MINWFKKNKVKPALLNLLKEVILSAPNEYHFLVDQVSTDYFLGSDPNPFQGGNWKSVSYNEKARASMAVKNINGVIGGIKVFNRRTDLLDEIQIDISNGFIIGYSIGDMYANYDTEKVDNASFYFKSYEFEEESIVDEEFIKHIGENNKSNFCVSDINVSPIEINNRLFFPIIDLEDGNYIAISKENEIYGIIHDPFEIEKLFSTKESFIDELKSGKFEINSYYDKKMSK